jgi:hypothetical protein
LKYEPFLWYNIGIVIDASLLGKAFGKEIMDMRIRMPYDRRSGRDRRKVYNRRYFLKGGVERRSGEDRRTGGERRSDWTKLTRWSSVWEPNTPVSEQKKKKEKGPGTNEPKARRSLPPEKK